MQDQCTENFFAEILKSETTLVRCNGCGTDQPVNNNYLQYLTAGLQSCSKCRTYS